MAKPLNLAEHKAAFSKFLIFFFLTVALVAMALYFNFKIPSTELQILRTRSEILRNQNIAQENYKRTLQEFLIKSKGMDSMGIALAQGSMQPSIDRLQTIPNIGDTLSSSSLNNVLLTLANSYLVAKLDLLKVKNYQETIDKYGKQIAEKDEKIRQLQTEVLGLRSGSGYIPPPQPMPNIPQNPPR
jgi:cell division protein FtsL